ncbi:MAG TPA: tetratricopeptide repeat protein [Vicinamibacteria bacterium]
MAPAALLLLAALGLPELPVVPLAELPEAVRERVAGAYRRAEREPASAPAAGELGMLLHAYDQARHAEAAYDRARALDPGAFEWAYLAGVVQARLGRSADAIGSLRAAVGLEPGSVAARARLAEALLAARDLDGAAAQYGTLAGDRPQLPQLHYGLGRVAAARGDRQAAAGHFRDATARFEAYGAAHYALALVYRDLGKAEEARRHLALFEKHRLEEPALQDPLLDRVRGLKTGAGAHLALGLRLARDGDLEGAVREHERAVAADPRMAQAHANLISLYGRLNRGEDAERHYRAAVALAPGLAEAHYDYGVLLGTQGRPAEAAAAFRRALEISPRYAQAHHNLGLLLEAEGRRDDAERHYRQAVANQAGYREARFHLGRVLVALGRPREAAVEFERILTPDDADTPRYLFALAAALVRAGEREKALAYAREARERALARGQPELAAAIERDLRGLEAPVPPR